MHALRSYERSFAYCYTHVYLIEVKKFTSTMRYYGNLTSHKMADMTSEVVVTTSQRRARRRTHNPEEWKKTIT